MDQHVIPYILVAIGLMIFAWVAFQLWGNLLAGSKNAETAMQDDDPKINQSVNIDTLSGGNVSPAYNNHLSTIAAQGQHSMSEEGGNDCSNIEIERRKSK